MFSIFHLPVNMLSKIEMRGDCWHWIAAVNSRGYSCVTNGKGKSVLAHRRSYELLAGEIPEGLTIDHLCRNIRCINPAHLEPVTQQENTRRAFADVTHCKRGHPLSGDNVRYQKRSWGRARACRTCQSAYMKAYRLAAKRAA